MGTLETKRTHLVLGIGLVCILALNLWLYAPLFDTKPTPYRGSIAAGYAGITRFISEHPNPWGWNPQQYAGQPTQFSYPPLIPYTAGMLHWITGMEPFRAYRFVVALSACFGPVTLAFAFYFFTRSLFWSLALGVAYSVAGPLYGLFERIDADRGVYYLPWRLLVMIKYGEGPHVTSLTVLPLILVALRWGLPRKDFCSLFAMAVSLAVAPLMNWLGAFAVTLSILWMLATDFSRVGRLLTAGALGYLLAAFWLTPDYIATTLFNWPKDSYGYRVEQSHWPLYLGLVATVIILSVVLRSLGATWLVRYATVSAAAFSYIVGGFYWFGIDTIPESRRYALELELFLTMAIFSWCWVGSRSRHGVDRLCVAIAVVALLVASAPQIRQSLMRPQSAWNSVDDDQTLEFRLAQWLADAKPHGRVFATGSLRFRLNAWFPLHQVGGTFESGLRNRIAMDHYYQVRTGESSKPEDEAQDALHELTAIGAEYAVVHDLSSEEYYKDIKNPAKFEQLGPVVFAPTPHDRIYKLPFRSYAHLVKASELPKDRWKDALLPFYSALADMDRPTIAMVELDPGHWRIEGPIPEGQQVSVSMNWDPGWVALQDRTPLPVGRNELGLIQLSPKPKAHSTILLNYEGTLQQKLFALLSLVGWIGSITLCIRSRSWLVSTSTPSS